MKLNFCRYLDHEIHLQEFEKWIYSEEKLETFLESDDYQFLIAFNYKKNSAAIELQDFIFKKIITEKEFSLWKIDRMILENNLLFPSENLFSYAKKHPKYLKEKSLKFVQYWTRKEIEINWNPVVFQLDKNISEETYIKEDFLSLGTYENSYIHIAVNRRNEIWLAYDVIDKAEFWAMDMRDGIAKLFLGSKE